MILFIVFEDGTQLKIQSEIEPNFRKRKQKLKELFYTLGSPQRVSEGASGTGVLQLPLSNVFPQYFSSNRNMQC